LPVIKSLLLCLLLFPRPSPGDAGLLEKVRSALRASQPFRVVFVQQVFIADQKEIEESGEIIFIDHQHLRWNYLVPEKKIFLLQGDAYQFLLAEEGQLLRGRIGRQNEQLIWQILFDDRVDRPVTIDKKETVITIQGREDDFFSQLEVHVNRRYLPERVVQTDVAGLKTIYQFSHYQERLPLKSAALRFDIPAGVEIIDQ